MKGVLILTEGRSGSNWVGSLLHNTNIMGRPSEWLDWNLHESRPKGSAAYIEAIVAKASTQNQRFAIKIFPRHLYFAQIEYGIDFIRECCHRHEVGLVRLSRRDRMRQAISYARGQMTSQWAAQMEAKAKPLYSFKAISEAYFYIERSEAFWNSYLQINKLNVPHFIYEDLMPDPSPFVRTAAEILDVSYDGDLRTDLRIQRDELTEEWLGRFQEELMKTSPLPYAKGRTASRTVRNLMRFFRRRPLTPL